VAERILITEKISRNYVRLSIIAQKLEDTGKFYMVFWKPKSKAPNGRWKVYELKSSGEPGRFLAHLYITNDTYEITCSTEWRHLSPSDSLGIDLEKHLNDGLASTKWILHRSDTSFSEASKKQTESSDPN
jgi:hypothetical protein